MHPHITKGGIFLDKAGFRYKQVSLSIDEKNLPAFTRYYCFSLNSVEHHEKASVWKVKSI
jgi:hypothetical protein